MGKWPKGHLWSKLRNDSSNRERSRLSLMDNQTRLSDSHSWERCHGMRRSQSRWYSPWGSWRWAPPHWSHFRHSRRIPYPGCRLSTDFKQNGSCQWLTNLRLVILRSPTRACLHAEDLAWATSTVSRPVLPTFFQLKEETDWAVLR